MYSLMCLCNFFKRVYAVQYPMATEQVFKFNSVVIRIQKTFILQVFQRFVSTCILGSKYSCPADTYYI